MAKWDSPSKNSVPKVARYTANLNIVLQRSKKMSVKEKEDLMADEPDKIHVLIVDADDAEKVLVDEVVAAKAFTPDNYGQFSVGYGLRAVDISFPK